MTPVGPDCSPRWARFARRLPAADELSCRPDFTVLIYPACLLTKDNSAVDTAALPFQKKWGDDTFLVIEKWESMDALKAHAAAPHMAAYGAKVKEMIAGRTIHILSPT